MNIVSGFWSKFKQELIHMFYLSCKDKNLYGMKIKVIFLSILLLCNSNLHAAKPSQDFVTSSSIVSYELIGLSGACLLHDMIQNTLDSISKFDDLDKEEQEETIRRIIFLKYLIIGLGIAAGVYCVYGIGQLYSIGSDIYNTMYPSDERQAILKAAAEKNKCWDAKFALQDCLVGNVYTSRNNDGIPTACEQAASMFGMLAGSEALDEMISNFKACCN